MKNLVQLERRHGRPQRVQNHESKMVGVLFEYTVGTIYSHDIFTFDYGRLTDTIAHQNEQIRTLGGQFVKKRLRAVLIDAMEHRVEDSPENLEFIRTIVINWLCTYHSPSSFISKAPNQSIGFVFSVNDIQSDPLISTTDYNTFLKMLNRLFINLKKSE